MSPRMDLIWMHVNNVERTVRPAPITKSIVEWSMSSWFVETSCYRSTIGMGIFVNQNDSICCISRAKGVPAPKLSIRLYPKGQYYLRYHVTHSGESGPAYPTSQTSPSPPSLLSLLAGFIACSSIRLVKYAATSAATPANRSTHPVL